MRIQSILDAAGVDYLNEAGHHHCRPGWLQMDCPNCSPGSGRYRLGFRLKHSYFNCWVCGRLRIGDTLSALTGLSYQALKGDIKELQNQEQEVWSGRRATGTLKVPAGIVDFLPAHERYIRKRGFDPTYLADVWGVRGIGPLGNLAWRLWIPVHYHGEVVSWTTRAIKDTGGLRYISAKEDQEKISKKYLLYGEDFCRNGVIVHEGAPDAWATGTGAVATLGLTLSQEQRNRLKDYTIRVICFDNEPAAQQRAEALCDWLKVYPGETYNVQLSGKDAASSPKRELIQLRKMIR